MYYRTGVRQLALMSGVLCSVGRCCRLGDVSTVGNADLAAEWWDHLRQWEQDDVEAWWHDRNLPFPLSAGLKQVQSGLTSPVTAAEEMTVEVQAFLQAHLGSPAPAKAEQDILSRGGLHRR